MLVGEYKEFPWNAKNSNVLILAGDHVEYFALKYGVCILPTNTKLIPCRYLAIYENDTIKYLFEISKNPYYDVTFENLTEFKEIAELEKGRSNEWIEGTESWMGSRKKCIFFFIKKISDVGPIINDYFSKKANRVYPLTRGTPRYTTLEKIKKAKLTSELECQFDNDDPLPPEKPKEVIIPPPPPSFWEKWKLYIIFGVTLLISGITFAVLLMKPAPPPIVVVKEVEKKKPPRVAELGDNNFEQGKYELNYSSTQTLKAILFFLQDDKSLMMKIVGHTDNIGREDKNIELSLNRALSVKNWFVSNGIDSSRMVAEGKGDSIPKNDNSTVEGRKLNRRVEITIFSK